MIAAYERSLKYTEHKLEKIRNRLEELPLGDAVVTDHQLALFLLNDIIRYYRTVAICGEARMGRVVASYNRFLDFLGDPATREHLATLNRSDRGDERFREIKNEGHHFTRELLKVFEGTVDSTHPIRRAVVF